MRVPRAQLFDVGAFPPMSQPALEMSGLRKEYRSRRGTVTAVDGLDLVVEEGGVFGFLGPNGSGKTTTIRCALGLVRPTAGAVTIFGHPVPRHLAQVRSRIGALVETPKFFPSMTARDNLDLLARLKNVHRSGGGDGRGIDEVTELVGLTDRIDDTVGSYSLGMRQRLAVAATMLGAPDLLVLDEPANGLDPAGIHEMRELIRSLGDAGHTVFVSSHQLADVERVCDRVAIVAKGRLVAATDVRSLTDRRDAYRLRVADADAAARIFVERGWSVEAGDGRDELVVEGAPDGASLTEELARHGLFVSELTRAVTSLEQTFLELTADTQSVEPSPARPAPMTGPE